MNAPVPEYRTLDEFYPFYLSEHSNRTSRRLHFIGTSLAPLCFLTAAFTFNPWYLLLAIVIGYAFAWVGHFFYEHNRPATFQYPWLSYIADWKMWWQTLTGKIAW